MPQWTVEVDVLTTDYDAPWPPKIEHPDVEPVDHYGHGRELAGEGIREVVNVRTFWVAATPKSPAE